MIYDHSYQLKLKSKIKLLMIYQSQQKTTNHQNQTNIFNQFNRPQNCQQMTELILSFIYSSTFFQYLRNNYLHFLLLQDEEKKNLIKSTQIFKIKEDKATMLINYNQPTISIMIYGQLKMKGKVYQKGHYFVTSQQKVEIEFLKKTNIVMLNKQDFENIMNHYQCYYMKKQLIQKIFPFQFLSLSKRVLRIFVQNSHIVQRKCIQTQPINQINKQKGIFLVIGGVYTIQSREKIKLLEINFDIFGEQILWNQQYEFQLCSESQDHKYLFVHKDVILELFCQDTIEKIKLLYEKKRSIRLEILKRYKDGLQIASLFLKSRLLKNNKKIDHKEHQQFHQVLSQIQTKPLKLKQLIQRQMQLVEEAKMTEVKNQYVPRKLKPRFFSTIKKFNADAEFMDIFSKQEKKVVPFKPKLVLHQRAKTQIVFKRSLQGSSVHSFQESNKPRNTQKTQKIRAKTSYGSQSNTYDRTYSQGINILSKIKKYDEEKKSARPKKKEKVLKTNRISGQLSQSFKEVQKTAMPKFERKNTQQLELLGALRIQKIKIQRHMTAKTIMTWR